MAGHSIPICPHDELRTLEYLFFQKCDRSRPEIDDGMRGDA